MDAKYFPDTRFDEDTELKMRLRMRQLADDRGHYLVEFSFSILPLLILIFGVVEVSRMVLVYNTVAHAARAGVRYAIVHGSDSSVSKSQIQTIVTNFLSVAPMNAASVTPTVTYEQKGTPAADCTNPGCKVTVSVSYTYDPLTTLAPLSVNLSSTSEGVIVF
jgi:Flp pilus assembly protein TadG